ncbi:acetyltransferase [Anaeromusa acidaminophila]|uniref:acetyltransferase n=1 Tax=Anaeromusa acidaminophila TaxID=81464 RepID=UPI00037A7338|nr:acetyltransferase [Anaeromusa acidaminophila]
MKQFEKPVILLGAGGHAKVLADLLLSQGKQIIGVTDVDKNLYGKNAFFDIPVLGPDETVLQYNPDSVGLVNALGSIRATNTREKLFQCFYSQGYLFPNLIHPTAFMGKDVQLGSGVQLMAGAYLQTGVKIADNVIVNTGALVEHDCVLAAHAHIASRAVLAGGVFVGERSHVGAGAVVIQGVNIGRDCTIAAGAAIVKNVVDASVVAGVPGRVLQCNE